MTSEAPRSVCRKHLPRIWREARSVARRALREDLGRTPTPSEVDELALTALLMALGVEVKQ